MDDKARLADLENKVAMLMRAMGTIDKERRDSGRAPLFDEQLLAINARVAGDLKGANVPKVKHPEFSSGKTAA